MRYSAPVLSGARASGASSVDALRVLRAVSAQPLPELPSRPLPLASAFVHPAQGAHHHEQRFTSPARLLFSLLVEQCQNGVAKLLLRRIPQATCAEHLPVPDDQQHTDEIPGSKSQFGHRHASRERTSRRKTGTLRLPLCRRRTCDPSCTVSQAHRLKSNTTRSAGSRLWDSESRTARSAGSCIATQLQSAQHENKSSCLETHL